MPKNFVTAAKDPTVMRIGRIFKWLERFKYTVFRLILGLIILAHWVGCMFYMIARLEYLDAGETYEEYMLDENDRTMATTDKYMKAILIALYMLIMRVIDPNHNVANNLCFYCQYIWSCRYGSHYR